MKTKIHCALFVCFMLFGITPWLQAQYFIDRATWESRLGGTVTETDWEFEFLTVGEDLTFDFSGAQNLQKWEEMQSQFLVPSAVEGNERFPNANAAVLSAFEEEGVRTELRTFIQITDEHIAGQGFFISSSTAGSSISIVNEYRQKQPLEFFSGTLNQTRTVIDTLDLFSVTGQLDEYTVYTTAHTYKGNASLILPGESAIEATLWYITEREQSYSPDGTLEFDEEYYYLRLVHANGSVELELFDPYTDQPVSVDSYYQTAYSDGSGTSLDETTQPSSFVLMGNYPNPFNPSTQIRFELASTQAVELSVYNIMGTEVYRSGSNIYSSGTQQMDFNATNLPGGVYLYRLRAGNLVQTGKMTLVK